MATYGIFNSRTKAQKGKESLDCLYSLSCGYNGFYRWLKCCVITQTHKAHSCIWFLLRWGLSCRATGSTVDFCEQEANLGHVAGDVNHQQITGTVEDPNGLIRLILEEGNYIKMRNDQELWNILCAYEQHLNTLQEDEVRPHILCTLDLEVHLSPKRLIFLLFRLRGAAATKSSHMRFADQLPNSKSNFLNPPCSLYFHVLSCVFCLLKSWGQPATTQS